MCFGGGKDGTENDKRDTVKTDSGVFYPGICRIAVAAAL